MPGRTYSSGNSSYRYSINGQEKTPEIAPNTTTAEFWQYDSRIMRRWNVDPKPNVKCSPYSVFNGNPLFFIDPRGDTAIFNDKGIVLRNDKNSDGLVFYQYTAKENGKDVTKLQQFNLNDKGMDASQVNNFDVGKQMVRFLTEDNTNWILNKAGADNGGIPIISHIQAGLESNISMDFGLNFLAPNIRGKDGAEGVDKNDNYSIWDHNGGFIYFIGSNSISGTPRMYNVPDAGNFLFGAAAGRMNIGYADLVMGSQLNEIIKGGADSKSDQIAIKQGYLYEGHLKTLQNPIIRWFTGYDKVRPNWFDKKNDAEMRVRRKL